MKTLRDFYRLFPSHAALVEQPSAALPVPVLRAIPAVAPIAADDSPAGPRYRQRDFGTGYGRSSGYARASYSSHSSGQSLRVR